MGNAYPRCSAAAFAAAFGLACGGGGAPATRVCSEILAREVPGAEVVETWPGAGSAAFRYRLEDDPDLHRFGCVLAESEPGRLRAQSLRVDERELSEAELLLVNSELMLDEIRRADPGARTPRRWAAWLEDLLARI